MASRTPKKHTMANEEDKLVWVKLVIDGRDQYAAFKVVAKKRDDVDNLKVAIMEKAKRLFEKDIHSLDVYRPGTNALDPGNENLLFPYLPLADWPRGITGQTPLIVTAKTRPQQQQDTNVSLCRWQILS
jgi:hypothetical protein